MAELTNAQAALREAVVSSINSSGTYSSPSGILRQADVFLQWLDEKDSNDV